MENHFLIDSDKLTQTALEKKHRLETDPSSRIDHMKYLPGMDVIESDVCEHVMKEMKSYDYSKYSAKDVRRALAKDKCDIEDFKALLSPAAEPFWSKWQERQSLKPASTLEIQYISLHHYI